MMAAGRKEGRKGEQKTEQSLVAQGKTRKAVYLYNRDRVTSPIY